MCSTFIGLFHEVRLQPEQKTSAVLHSRDLNAHAGRCTRGDIMFFSCGAAEHEKKKTKRLLSNPRIPVCTLVGLALKLSQQLVLWRIASGRNVVDYLTADCIFFLLGICLCMRDVGCDFEHQHSARATAGGGGERDGTWAAVVFTTCSAEWA